MKCLPSLFVVLMCVLAQQTLSADVQHIDIGGRKLTMSVQGNGGPTVVIESGFGAPAVEDGEWQNVVDAISKTNRVCVYDRAGVGTSDPDPKKPRTSRNIARDLHTLLTNAKIPGPYVLVAQSIGGLHVRVFADLYPNEVAGMVLVDVTHPDQESKWLAVFPPKRDGENIEITKARDLLNDRLTKPAENSENFDFVASDKQVRAARTLGSKPLVILTHKVGWVMVPGLPDDLSDALDRVSQDLQKQLLTLSTNSTQRNAEHAGHHVHREEPELVITAIQEVVAKVNRPVKK